MSHWRSMFDNKYLGNWDLPEGRDITVTIEKVEAGSLTMGGKTDRKPICHFVGKSKPMPLNKTNSKAIAGIYGNDTSRWVGKPIALYVTQTSSPDGMVPCIRVRPTPPKRSRANGAASPEPMPSPGATQDEPQQDPGYEEGGANGPS